MPLDVTVDGSADRYTMFGRTTLPGWLAMGYPPQSRKLQRPSIFTKGGYGRLEAITLDMERLLGRKSGYVVKSQLEFLGEGPAPNL